MPIEAIIRANAFQVGASEWGQFTYGPVPDGSFVPGMPGILYNTGDFVPNITILTSHCANEGAIFTPPYLRTENDVDQWLLSTFPLAPTSVREYILNMLYPPVYDGSQPYKTLLERIYLMVSEMSFVCNTNFINRAYGNKGFAYYNDIFPSFHGCDSAYNFYDREPTNLTTGFIATQAQQLQDYQINFMTSGNPNGPGLPPWPMQGQNASCNLLTTKGWSIVRDPTSNPRCAWWQKGLTN
jgi:carboxylesterase type B